MFERLRFARYALKFERAFKTDDWSEVLACFTPGATYTLVGGAQYDGTARGRDAIVESFKRMLNELDRKFDRRIPGMRGWWSVKAGVLHVPWKARYVLGRDSVMLTGESTCRFEGGKIAELSDTMNAVETEATLGLLRRSGRSATPS